MKRILKILMSSLVALAPITFTLFSAISAQNNFAIAVHRS